MPARGHRQAREAQAGAATERWHRRAPVRRIEDFRTRILQQNLIFQNSDKLGVSQSEFKKSEISPALLSFARR